MLRTGVGIPDFRNLLTNFKTMSSSTTLVKVQRKGQVTIPTHLRQQAGIAEGDVVEAIYKRGHIVLTPQLVIDRTTFPNANDEYTPAQRKVIDARLAVAQKEIDRGQTYGPFATHKQFLASLHKESKKLRATKKTKRKAR